MQTFRKITSGIIITLVLLLVVDQVVIPDSRRPKLRSDAEAQAARLEKGRSIIMNACAAAGGIERWRSKQDVSLRLADNWRLPIGVWPESNLEAMHYYLLHRKIGRVEMESKKGLHQWGLYRNRPWALLNGIKDSDGIKDADYAISSFIYFFEMPFNFLDEGAYPEFVGEEIIDGKVYEKVYVSFGLNFGFYPTDWYLAYFDKTAGRLAFVVYTSLEKSPSFVEYNAAFDDYREIGGLIIPTSVVVKMSRPISGIRIHEWKISDVRFDGGLSDEFFKMPGGALAKPKTMSMR
jgi:hypothetical protein